MYRHNNKCKLHDNPTPFQIHVWIFNEHLFGTAKKARAGEEGARFVYGLLLRSPLNNVGRATLYGRCGRFGRVFGCIYIRIVISAGSMGFVIVRAQRPLVPSANFRSDCL